MTAQGVNKNVLDGLVVDGMIAIHSAAALRGAEVNPVPGSIARPAKTGTVHQGFKQKRPVTVNGMPVVRQSPGGKRKDLACESFHLNPGQNKKPTLVYDELQIAFPLFGIPSDPGIAGRHHPCGAGKLQAGEIPARQLLGLDEIAQVSPEGDAIADVMVAVDVLLEQGIEIPVGSLDEVEGQGIEISRASRDRVLNVALSRTDNAPRARRSCVPKARQCHETLIPKMFEKGTALFILEFAGRPFPLDQFADGFGQFGEAEVGKITDGLMDECKLGGLKSTAGKRKHLFRHGWTPLSSGFLTLSESEENVPGKMQSFKNILRAGCRGGLG